MNHKNFENSESPDLSGKQIILTPNGTLRFGDACRKPWQQGLLELGAVMPASPIEAFWRKIGRVCINYLAHAAQRDNPAPEEAIVLRDIQLDADEMLNSAPPMPGGEYLNHDILTRLWNALLAWCEEEIRRSGGIAPFLEQYAPGWEHVGQVFFHLGENRMDSEYPFAFLATYSTGLNEKGHLRHTPLANARSKFTGNSRALVKLLEPVARAAKNIGWVGAMCESGEIYQARPWKIDEAYQFLCSVNELEKSGIGIRVPDWWKKRPRLQIQTEISAMRDPGLGTGTILEFDPRLALGDELLDENEMNALLSSNTRGLVLVKNQWVEIDSEKLNQALEHWRKAKKAAASGELTFMQGMRLLAGLGSNPEDNEQQEDIREWSRPKAGAGFRELLQYARDETHDELAVIPGLDGQLRPYQAKGVAWLGFLNRLGLGACLADDMGLGKTIQAISLLLLEKGKHEMPALLIAPASLLANWRAECERFAPNLRVLLLHPSANSGKLDARRDDLGDHDLVITSYGLCSRLKWLQEVEWSRIIADEAQNIKNGRTKQSIAVRRLKAPARIALTGTPIENNVGDLWAIFDFINPGLLGNSRQFNTLLNKMQKSSSGLAPLKRVSAPYILRRMKTDKNIIASLPDKTEVTLCCNLTAEQAKLYMSVVQKMRDTLESLESSSDKTNARNLLVLQNLVLLKQICNHPAQAGLADGYDPRRSGKFLRIGELCQEIAARQEKVLVFTQFREIIDPLAHYLESIFKEPGLSLHGGTPVKRRADLVNKFQTENGPPFFIISLKAGGSGLNLTNASHVIHFDRWWNPAVENQATDRAYRIGQKKNVLVHKCQTMGTLEEKIADMLARKKLLAEDLLGGIECNIAEMSDAEILALVSLDANSIVE